MIHLHGKPKVCFSVSSIVHLLQIIELAQLCFGLPAVEWVVS